MRTPLALGAILFLLLAGCTDKSTVGTTATPSETPPPEPRQVLSRDNDAACPETFQTKGWEFTVDDGYDRLILEFHASGAGQLGLRIQNAKGEDVKTVPQQTLSSQPCTHSHEGGAITVEVTPGKYRAVVEGQGVLGYHLTIVEKSSQSNETGHSH